mgnify:CR=1 FL=1
MDFQKERESFEKHASKFFTTNKAFEDDGENYVYDEVKFMWDCWLAAKAQAVPEGFVFVPKEPTDKTIAHMINTPIEVNLLCDHADIFLSEGEAYIAYQAIIEAQEPTND